MTSNSVSGAENAAASGVRGAGKALIVVYVILAIAATFRSLYQIISKFDEAPVAYSLSAAAGVVYIVASVALIAGARVRAGDEAASSRRRLWQRVATVAVSFELVGVLVVGVLSFAVPQLFAHPSVWSWFGAGYLCIPLVLPVLGLLWLRKLKAAS